MAQKFHLGWITQTGSMIIEKAETFKDANAAAEAASLAAFPPEIQKHAPVIVESVDGTLFVLVSPADHAIVLTEEQVEQMIREKQRQEEFERQQMTMPEGYNGN